MARGRRSEGSARSVTSPQDNAVRASMVSADRSIRSARPSPMIRGSRWVPPTVATIPIFGSGAANVADRAAIRMSQARASSRPPPTARPFTAAMTGLVTPPSSDSPPKFQPGSSGGVPVRSLPALKARVPAPVRIATRRLAWASKRSQILLSSPDIGGVRAFRCRSLASVMSRTSGRGVLHVTAAPSVTTAPRSRHPPLRAAGGR